MKHYVSQLRLWVDFSHKNEHVRSYSIYEHDPTLKIAFGAIFFADFNEIAPNMNSMAAMNVWGTMDRRYEVIWCT